MKRSIRQSNIVKLLSGTVLGASAILATAYLSTTTISSYQAHVNSAHQYAAPPVFASTTSTYNVIGNTNGAVSAAANPTGVGYWTVTKDGTVTAHDGAKFYGDTYTDGITGLGGSHPLNAPIVGIAATSNGQGYWLVAADGGVFDFGNAQFHGSTYTYGITGLSGSHPLNAPVVGIVGDPSGGGYWLVAADGGVFDFGNAQFHGSVYTYGITGLTGSRPLNAPIVGAVASPNGDGYYLVGADGGVFDFGSAKFSGSTYDLGYTGLKGSRPLPGPITDIMPNPNGSGYYVVCKTGKVIPIGGAPSFGNGNVGTAVAIIPTVPTTKTSTPPTTTKTSTPPTTTKTSTPPTTKTYIPPSTPYIPPTTTQQPPPSTQAASIALGNTSLDVTNNAVNARFSASGGTAPYTYSSSDLPSGLTLSSSGALTGTLSATATKTFTFTVDVKDSVGDTGSGTATVIDTVSTAAPLAISATPLATVANVSATLQASGGSGGNTWTATGLPTGLTLSSAGVLTGVLNGGVAAKTYSFSATVIDSSGASATQTITLDYQPTQLSQSTVDFTTGSSSSVTLVAKSSGTYTYTLATGSTLPSGLSLSSSGVLSGTPAASDVSVSVNVDIYLNGDLVGTAPLSVSIASASAIPVYSESLPNWAGVVDSGTGITQTSGSFTVPTLSSTQSSTCQSDNLGGMGQCTMAEWVGVDGFGTKYLIQAGVNVTPTWSSSTSTMTEAVTPWYEIITPTNLAPETLFPMPAVAWKAGDTVSVSLQKVATGTWTIVLTDTTNGESYTEKNIAFTASAAPPENAEWIGETTKFGSGSAHQYSLLPAIASGGQFTNRTLTMGTVSGSYAVSRSCTSSGSTTCDTPSTDVTAPTSYGSYYSLEPFGFTW